MSAPTVTVRPAEACDAAALTPLTGQLGYPAPQAVIESRLAAILPREDVAIRVAEIDGQIVGWVQMHERYLLFDDRTVEVDGLVVHEACRSQGIGRILMEAAEGWARMRGCTAVVLRSNIIRERAHAFYLEIGYENIKNHRTFRRELG
ncbi:MAG: GNAT family N-acetyltransferase [Anaerolineae bacterium]|nr:GNAT family N-acetyltransferase [Anaerolineae bacterium]